MPFHFVFVCMLHSCSDTVTQLHHHWLSHVLEVNKILLQPVQPCWVCFIQAICIQTICRVTLHASSPFSCLLSITQTSSLVRPHFRTTSCITCLLLEVKLPLYLCDAAKRACHVARYRNTLSHDVTRLGAGAIKRRYPPGMVPGQEHEEITLVQSDIEGSTEIWEW